MIGKISKGKLNKKNKSKSKEKLRWKMEKKE